MKKGPADYRQVGEYDNHLFSYNDNQQHIADTIINLVEDDFDILSIKLPLQPGSDLFSKNLCVSSNLLRDQSIKNTIITEAIGNGITGEVYSISANEQHDGRRADLVNHAFVARAIQYCLNVFDDVKALSVLVVISTDGFSSKTFRDFAFDKSDSNSFYTHPCQDIDSSPIDPMIALAYVLTLQQKSILMLDEYDDSTIQDIYKVAVSRKRLCQYAEDGINFARQYKRQHLCTKSPGVTPGRTTTSEKPSGDLAFVTNERAQLAGRFNWASCYGEGRSVGMFIRYSSHTSLK
ncbi:hypothetical protein AB4K20DRAFT_1975130 [Rhizopus microsporus]